MSVTTSAPCWCATTVATVPLPALSAAIRSVTGAGRVTSHVVTADPATSTAAASA